MHTTTTPDTLTLLREEAAAAAQALQEARARFAPLRGAPASDVRASALSVLTLARTRAKAAQAALRRATRKPRLGKLEARAKAWCDRIQRDGSAAVAVEWVRSRTWGSCPRVLDDSGDKVAQVSGCGFCKHSTALADALRWLGKDAEERMAIARTGGAGVPAVVAALDSAGWTLTHTHDGRNLDVYTLTRKA